MGELIKARRLDIGNDLCNYFLMAVPAKEVADKVSEERSSFSQFYGNSGGLGFRPHIMVAAYTAKERMEERLDKWIQNICSLQNSFIVTLNNYSGFPPHTIYLRVQNAEPFIRLGNALTILDGFMDMNECGSIQVFSKPYLAISGQLPEAAYEIAIKEYAHKSFHETFRVDRLTLMKRETSMEYQLVNTFILPPQGGQSE